MAGRRTTTCQRSAQNTRPVEELGKEGAKHRVDAYQPSAPPVNLNLEPFKLHPHFHQLRLQDCKEVL